MMMEGKSGGGLFRLFIQGRGRVVRIRGMRDLLQQGTFQFLPVRAIIFPDWLARTCICSKALLCNIVSCPPPSGQVGCVADALKAKPLFFCLLVWFGSLIWGYLPWKWRRWNMVDIVYHQEACSRPDGRASQEGETGDGVTCTPARGTRLQLIKWSHAWTWIDIIRHILLCV